MCVQNVSIFIFVCVGLNNAFADSHDKTTVTVEEPLPLNDPFAGDASIDGSSGLLAAGSEEERERFSQNSHDYLIEQVQSNIFNGLTGIIFHN